MSTHGYVVGRFIEAIAQAGDEPHLVASRGGVKLQPTSIVTVTGLDSGPASAMRTSRKLTLDDQGWITTLTPDKEPVRGAWVIPGRYDVITDFMGDAPRWKFQVDVTTDHTPENPLDLTLAAPVDLPPQAIEVVRVEDRDRAEAAAAAAEDALAQALAAGLTVDASAGTRVTVGSQVIYYDSGVRDITSLLLPGWSANGRCTIQRTATLITVVLRGIVRAEGAPVHILPLLAGFGTDYRHYLLNFGTREFIVSGAGNNLQSGNIAVNQRLGNDWNGLVLTWPAPSTLPSALPGTPV